MEDIQKSIDHLYLEMMKKFGEMNGCFDEMNGRIDSLDLLVRKDGVMLEQLEHKLDLPIEILQGNIESLQRISANHEGRITNIELYRP